MFSKKSAESAQPANRQPMAGSTFSVFGPDVVIAGDVTASADLHIDGRIEGDIRCAALVQGEGSAISGLIEAASARLAGTVRGSITAGSLVILKSARIEGDVTYDELTIEQGAQVDGKLTHRSEPKLTLAGGTQAV